MKKTKSFIQFLKESNIDQELNNCKDEKYFSINEDGSLDFVDESDSMSLDDIANACFTDSVSEAENSNSEEVPSKDVKPGFGGEVYVSLDFPELNDDIQALNEAKKGKKKSSDELESGEAEEVDDTETLKGLKQKRDSGKWDMKNVSNRNTKFKLDSDGTIKIYDPKTSTRRSLTQDEVDYVLNNKNGKNPYKSSVKAHYEMDDEYRLIVVKGDNKTFLPNEKLRTKFLKTLNTKVNDLGIHYKYDTEDKNKIKVNITPWNDDNKRDKNRFDAAQYKVIDNDAEKEVFLDHANGKKDSNLQPVANDKESEKAVYSYENGRFYKDGKPLEGKELEKFINGLNGGSRTTTKLLNARGWGKKENPYWETYKISIAGSKVGNAVNFNLPPVVTCNPESPCINDGCYAVKSYGMYPTARSAMECNYALLQQDSGFELFKKSMILALTSKGRNGMKFNLCRIHVNGDMFSGDYFDAICDIAKACSHVNFWMYTKQYDILSKHSGEIPSNLCVIVSCWGEFNPFDYKDGKYKELAKKFPLAYLDDGSEDIKLLNQRIQDLLGKPKDIQICPCTDADEIITHCESCKICFDKSLANNNLVFKKH